MAWTLTTSGAAMQKAGANASTAALSGAFLTTWSNEAEGRIVSDTRKDYVTNYAAQPTAIKNLLSDICSSLIAKQIITYDMSGYTSRSEAQTMLDVQEDGAVKGLNILRDFKSGEIKTP